MRLLRSIYPLVVTQRTFDFQPDLYLQADPSQAT
jgi:hypothetical protein